jgi:GAF domain-containing protein
MVEAVVPGQATPPHTGATGTSDADVDEALRALSRLLLTDETLETTMRLVLDVVVQAVGGHDAASVTLVDERGARTVAATDERAWRLDGVQYATGAGPCLHAVRTGDRVLVDPAEASETASEWPAFYAAAREVGLRCFVAVPLLVDGNAIGALNLFAHTDAATSRWSTDVLTLLAEQASVTLANAQRYAAATTLVRQLTEALESRAVIEQAKGVLMARHRVDADQAFDLLRHGSQQQNRKLRVIAAELVETAHRDEHGQAPE